MVNFCSAEVLRNIMTKVAMYNDLGDIKTMSLGVFLYLINFVLQMCLYLIDFACTLCWHHDHLFTMYQFSIACTRSRTQHLIRLGLTFVTVRLHKTKKENNNSIIYWFFLS